MKSSQRTQLEKFNMKQQKSAALNAELETIQKDNAKRTTDEYTKYGIVGMHELRSQGIDLEDDKVAMFTTWRGMETFFELTHTDRDRIIEMATAPLHHKITNLEEKVIGLEGIIAKLVEQNEKQSALIEKVFFTPAVKDKEQWLVPPKEEVGAVTVVKELKPVVPVQSIADLVKKPGRISDRVKAAKALLDSHTKNGKVRWVNDPENLCRAFVIILRYNGVNYDNTSIMQDKYGAFYLAVSRYVGKYKEFIATTRKEVK